MIKFKELLFITLDILVLVEGRVERKLCPVMNNVAQPASREDTSDKLAKLRSEMARMKSVRGPPLDAYIVTSYDQHMSQFVAERDKLLKYITGFTGGYGFAVITTNNSALWTAPLDVIQANEQLSCDWTLFSTADMSPNDWLVKELHPGSRIGVDYTLISNSEWEEMNRHLLNSSMYLTNVQNNLVDIIWASRPQYTRHQAHVLPIEYAGISWQHKVSSLRGIIKGEGCDALVVTALDEIAWLLNIRGRDIPYLPVLIAYLVLTKEHIYLYTDMNKIGSHVRKHLHSDNCRGPYCAKIQHYKNIFDDLQTFSQVWKKVWLSGPSPFCPGASKAITVSIPAEKRFIKRSPIVGLKAVKNSAEREGMRKAHIRDAAAICDIMAYFEQKLKVGEEWDEMSLASMIDQFRREQQLSQGISFATVVGFGPHGALPHYEPVNSTNLKIDNSSMFVIDSGGLYMDGTTDLTRTFHVGRPTDEQRTQYTRVLMGLINLSNFTFPEKVPISTLDTVARGPLWAAGLDYHHGTGHGIGAYLSVHEDPVMLTWETNEKEYLKDGYFFSIEPGYYVEDKYGIRLENIVEVVEHPNKTLSSGRFLKFNTVTLVPFEPKLIKLSMLSPQQVKWLNSYNKAIRDEVGAELKRQLRMKGFYWMMDRVHYIREDVFGTASSLMMLSVHHLFYVLVNTASIVWISKYIYS